VGVLRGVVGWVLMGGEGWAVFFHHGGEIAPTSSEGVGVWWWLVGGGSSLGGGSREGGGILGGVPGRGFIRCPPSVAAVSVATGGGQVVFRK